MFNQIKNREGEKLYILTIANTNSIKPYTYVNTWEECVKLLNKRLSRDDIKRIVHKDIAEDIKTASASVECTNYVLYLYIRLAYTDKW